MLPTSKSWMPVILGALSSLPSTPVPWLSLDWRLFRLAWQLLQPAHHMSTLHGTGVRVCRGE